MAKTKVGILVSGRGSNMEAILKASKSNIFNAEVVLVLSDKADAPALEIAKASKVPTVFLDPKDFPAREDYDKALVDQLNKAKVGLVCLAGYMRIVTPVFLKAFPNRIMNIHPALLPSFKGLHGQKQAFDYGVKVAGCTVHLVDAGTDTGPIVAQSAVPVLPDDTVDTLRARILAEEHRLLPTVVAWLAAGRVQVVGRRVTITG